MLKVYGIKTDKQTGEIIKDKTLLFNAISDYNLKTKGFKTALENGYTITEIWKIGTLQTRWADKKIYG